MMPKKLREHPRCTGLSVRQAKREEKTYIAESISPMAEYPSESASSLPISGPSGRKQVEDYLNWTPLYIRVRARGN